MTFDATDSKILEVIALNLDEIRQEIHDAALPLCPFSKIEEKLEGIEKMLDDLAETLGGTNLILTQISKTLVSLGTIMSDYARGQ